MDSPGGGKGLMIGMSLLLPHILIVIFLLILLTNAVINMVALRNLHAYRKPPRYPRISALVPARNEEEKIEQCVRSLLAQDYPDFQVIVLDDNSTDRTAEILTSLALENEHLKVIRGKPLPPDWLGKHWACHHLYKESDGELIIFTDADTVHTSDTFACTASAIINEKADMLSIIPKHIMGSWAEKLIMPFFALGVFANVPLPARFRFIKQTVISSSGKLMAFRRTSYELSGGFEGINLNVLDDLELPQKIIAGGMRYRLLDGTGNVSCRMYHNFKEVHEGLAKNIFAAFNYSVPLNIFTWLWFLFVIWEPLIVLLIYKIPDYPPLLFIGLSEIAVLEVVLLLLIYFRRFGIPLYLILFYPVSAILMAAISTSSMILTLSGRATWKDRKMPQRKIN